jgi:hypothetical protein
MVAPKITFYALLFNRLKKFHLFPALKLHQPFKITQWITHFIDIACKI